MIPIAHIQHWRSRVPWTLDAQVEQDLALSRAMVQIFSDPTVSSALVLRGGTSFNKLYVPGGSRYSEDIDLVQTTAAPIGPTLTALRALLNPWLGEPTYDASQGNATLRYRFTAEGTGSPLGLKVEINTREHFTVFGHASLDYAMESPWFIGTAAIRTYGLEELLGTKVRALYQRRKGRDLFDLWRGMAMPGVSPSRITQAFQAYMDHGGLRITAKDFETNLTHKMKDKRFLTDTRPLLSADTEYDPEQAARLVCEMLIPLLR